MVVDVWKFGYQFSFPRSSQQAEIIVDQKTTFLFWRHPK